MKSRSKSRVQLIASEPYRLFFPFALLAGIAGVLMWPLFYGLGVLFPAGADLPDFFPREGMLDYYPLMPHARMMIEGFVGGFAVGFLGTALPKMLGAAPFRVWQIGAMFSLYLGFCTSHMLGHYQVGDALFASMMLLLIGSFAVRVIHRKSAPPAGMVLAPLGLMAGTAGAIWSAFFINSGSPHLDDFFLSLLYQAFILLPLLGVGSFIFPMILAVQRPFESQTGAAAKLRWRRKAGEALMVGALLILTFWIEGYGEIKAMSWTRAVICFIWLTKESGWLQRKTAKGVMAFAIRAGIICLLGGMIGAGIFGDNYIRKIGLDHSLYIGGFGLITMIVATRVIFGHSGQGSKFNTWNKSLIWATGILIFGMLTRISADFILPMRLSHHIYAAACWIVVSIIWGCAILPSVKKRPQAKKRILPSPTNKEKPSLLDMNFRK